MSELIPEIDEMPQLKTINVFETNNCIIHTTQEKKVIVQGLNGYIVAENDNTLLICQLSEEQRIKQFTGEA